MRPTKFLRGIILAGALAATQALAQAAMFDGEVTKVDVAANKITLRHGPIKKFDMDMGMTMVFRVQDPNMLKGLKAGDKVKFDADKVNGQFTIVKIERSK